ncbi:MAG: hypothetical protein FD123_3617 [Bacteroidetes bacterium]|nr:MAG: hypothetical protein FD123_3617 [Bacteroidota bacterium]
MSKAGVAFVQADVGDLSPGGGARRFFVDIFSQYHRDKNRAFRLHFFTDRKSAQLLAQKPEFGHCSAYVHGMRSPRNRFNNLVENLDWLWKITRYRIRVVHICQYYHVSHYRRLKFLQRLPGFIRPKLVINFIHCNFPYEYGDANHPLYREWHDRFDPLFHDIRLDGVYSWYTLFKTYVEEKKLFRSPPVIHPIKTYCCDATKYFPAEKKENILVWAARFDTQKNPLLFVEALHRLRSSGRSWPADWKVMICGNGALEQNLREKLEEYKLNTLVELRTDIYDMSEIFSRSKCFVSTQLFENFTSLSMNEALSAGNAIVSLNVGQTDSYVREGWNGYLAKAETPDALADALALYFSEPGKHETLQRNSRCMTEQVHTTAAFIEEIEAFWQSLRSGS